MKTGTPRDRSAAVARLLLLPLVLLLSLSLGGFPTPTLAQEDCDAADVVVEEGELRSISNKKVQSHIVSLNLYMKTESSFEGITVKVIGTDGIEYTAWFPAENRCFPHDDTWYELLVFAKIKNDTSTTEFGFENGLCKEKCKKDTNPPGLQSHSLGAHGTSRWTLTYPKGCPTVTLDIILYGPKELPTCMEPPPPPPKLKNTLAMGSYFLLMVVIVVAVIFK
ncbi:uncharacterized protein LOC135092446 [Scylla paramamosain]|uniref:uncharacterized protein LOC135092446 n=1 Tax=Scylla paramamosain TaxID=85552 RepID=UPI003083C5BC